MRNSLDKLATRSQTSLTELEDQEKALIFVEQNVSYNFLILTILTIQIIFQDHNASAYS
jgi:hypothetical protein